MQPMSFSTDHYLIVLNAKMVNWFLMELHHTYAMATFPTMQSVRIQRDYHNDVLLKFQNRLMPLS